MSDRSHLAQLLDLGRHVFAETIDGDHARFVDSILRELDRQVAELSEKAPPQADYPQAWPMYAKALRRVIGALENKDRLLADRWAAVAFALWPLVRADYEALRKA